MGAPKRDADPPPTLFEHFTRFYYLEAALALWLTVGLTVMVFAVLIHINLSYIIGPCMMLIGIAFLGTTLVGALAWGIFGEYKLAGIMRVRRVILIIKFALVIAIGGLSIWASAIMIQRALA